MIRKPEFITFTGADDHTDVAGMQALSSRYPIEWAILFSTKRQGVDPRYPNTASRLLFKGGRFAAHLCGSIAADIVHGRNYPGIGTEFRRVQINHQLPEAGAIAQYGRWIFRTCIAQARGDCFPSDDSIQWLYDRSGGGGVAPARWPTHPGGDRLVGYAGGIGPDNVLEVIKAISAGGPYWIDMESKVRTNDRFDLALCRRVCERVYGRRPAPARDPASS
jgi:hypothetical protein